MQVMDIARAAITLPQNNAIYLQYGLPTAFAVSSFLVAMIPSSAPALTGARLDAFLDEVEACFPDDDAPSASAQAEALALLQTHPCQTTELGQLGRLFHVWRRAGEIGQALHVLDEQQTAVFAIIPETERRSALLHTLFWRLGVLRNQDIEGRLVPTLRQTVATLAEEPVADQPEDAWRYLAELAEQAGEHALHRQCQQARHACQVADADRAAYRAWDEAVLAARLGASHAAANEPEAARTQAEAVLRILAAADNDQDIDRFDWLNIGETIIPYAPSVFAPLAAQVRGMLPANLAQPLRRATEVRLARLESLARYAEGDIAAAVAKGMQGRFALSEDQDDAFSARIMDWLMAANRHAEAAELAFESSLNERQVSSTRACEIAAEQLQAGAQNAHWALTLAFAATTADNGWVAGDEEVDAFVNRHLDMARRWAPEHPAIELLHAMRLMDVQGAYADALPMLERVALHPPLANPDTVRRIWRCRVDVHGADKALDLPVVECAAAGWCYNMGVAMDFEIVDDLPEGTPWPKEAVGKVSAAYYEMGKKKYEAFFASGEGMMRDADTHTYSMLCNNLAIYYRHHLKNYDSALALHRRGIAASPFAEHYDGAMWCHNLSDRPEEFATSAEQLWNYVMEHGYGRHNPADYIPDLVCALRDIGRGNEIAIWLQRLERWWEELDEDEQEEQYQQYLSAQSTGLCNLAPSQPEDAVARLEILLPQILADGTPGHIRVSGKAFLYAGQKERALELFRKASVAGDENNEWHRKQRQFALDDLKEYGGSARPWWKIW